MASGSLPCCLVSLRHATLAAGYLNGHDSAAFGQRLQEDREGKLMFQRWRAQSQRQQRMRDAARVMLHLERAGKFGLGGPALQRQMQLSEERLEAAIQELLAQGLVKEVTHSAPNTWALRGGFQPLHAAERRWRLSSQGELAVSGA